MNSTGRVFISYASEDKSVADTLVGSLEHHGHSCWIAPRDISPGQRYAEAIVEAIESCGVFVILFSASASSSPHVANEIEKAASADRPLLLVRIDGTDPNSNREICLFLSSHQWYEAQFGSLDQHASQIADAVGRIRPRDPATGGFADDVATPSPAPAVVRDDRRSAIGVDIGSTNIRACIVDFEGDDVAIRREAVYLEQVSRPATGRSVIGQVRQIIEAVLVEHFAAATPIGIGLAVPGQVDPRAGTLIFGPGLEVRNVPFRTSLGTTFPGIPVRVDNDTRCATRCESRIGVGRDYDSFVCMFVGSGVGSGVVMGGQVVFGNNYCAGEIGHTKIRATGPPCACGQVGCLETFVNGNAISALARAKAIEWESREMATTLASLQPPIDPRDVAKAMDDGDAAAHEIADEVGETLGVGIANVLNLLNPAAIVLGGGVMTGFFLHMIDTVTGVVQRNALANVAHVPIVHSQYGDEGAAVGAGLLFHPAERWEF